MPTAGGEKVADAGLDEPPSPCSVHSVPDFGRFEGDSSAGEKEALDEPGGEGSVASGSEVVRSDRGRRLASDTGSIVEKLTRTTAAMRAQAEALTALATQGSARQPAGARLPPVAEEAAAKRAKRGDGGSMPQHGPITIETLPKVDCPMGRDDRHEALSKRSSYP